ncbi:MAG: hypothetical protein IPH07_30565 [Deltaproteobacteria bacterium]|nr:hypothetical protein [Deltaproteobacteria bacterium]MBK8715260.1 hypothetical protein [Deltaproteobacteria bacterium]MBP7285035.1 hypothetical protein [Nannocystaceae bacterium]
MWPSLWACALACQFDSSGHGGSGVASASSSESGSGDATLQPTTTASTSSATATNGTVGTGDSDGSSSAGEGPCEPGTLGCACNDGMCQADLGCVDGTCVTVCGNGTLEGSEQCDPPDDGPDQGCEADCTVSPGIAALALGHDHTCGMTHDGRLRCWGNGDHGKTGHADTANIGDNELPATVTDVDIGGAAVAVDLGSAFSCALRRNGQVYCWGFYELGRLGLGPSVMQDIGDSESPVRAGAVPLPANVIDVSVGGSHACAVIDDGAVYCWGDGNAGKLGYSATDPVGLTNTPMEQGPVPLGRVAARVAAGAGHTCVIEAVSGDVYCWGDAAQGILGNQTNNPDIGDDEPASASTKVSLPSPAIDISAGSQHTCVILDTGAAVCWGNGGDGRLGYGDTQDLGDNEDLMSSTLDVGGAAVLRISAGRAHTCALLDGGDVRCWGQGAAGKLGQGATDNLGDAAGDLPALIPSVVVDDDPTAQVLDIVAGGDHTCARLDGGRVRCWGEAAAGQLGYGTVDDIGNDPGELPSSAGDVPVGG